MSETHEQRIQRLTELAWKVCDVDDAQLIVRPGSVSVAEDFGSGSTGTERIFISHPRALAALEAALCVLAGEVPQWAVELAVRWRDSESAHAMHPAYSGAYSAMDGNSCADELLEAAKGKP